MDYDFLKDDLNILLDAIDLDGSDRTIYDEYDEGDDFSGATFLEGTNFER